MAVPLHDTVTARRAHHGAAQPGHRDIDGLVLCAEHYGAPYDLLAVTLGAQPARLRGIVARWRGRLTPPAGGWAPARHGAG